MSTLGTVWRALAISLACSCVAPQGDADTTEQAAVETFVDGEVNAVLGDASWVALYGERPGPDVPDAERIRTHLAYVDTLLRERDVSDLSPELQLARARNLDRLSAYRIADMFPENRPGVGRVPRFVDDDEDGALAALADVRLCAVGHLLAADLGVEAAIAIAADFQHAEVGAIDAPELATWAASSGLTIEELAMIQPSYGWKDRKPTLDSDGRLLPEAAMRVLMGAAFQPSNTCVHDRVGARAPHPKAAEVTVVIEPSGKMTSVSVSLPPAQHSETRQCIAEAVKKASFPAFKGKPLTVTQRIPIVGPKNDKGDLNRNYLRVVFERGDEAIRKCAAGEAGHHGDLAVNATAHPSGAFREIHLVNSDKPEFRACVVRVLSSLELPIFKGEPVKDGHVYLRL